MVWGGGMKNYTCLRLLLNLFLSVNLCLGLILCAGCDGWILPPPIPEPENIPREELKRRTLAEGKIRVEPYDFKYNDVEQSPSAPELARNIRTIFGDPDFSVVQASDGIEVDLQGWRLYECPETGDIGVAARYLIAPLKQYPDEFYFVPREPPGWASGGYAVHNCPDGFWHLHKQGLGRGIHYGRERLTKLDARRYGAIQCDVFFYRSEQ